MNMGFKKGFRFLFIFLFIAFILAFTALYNNAYSQQDVSEYQKRLTQISDQIREIQKKIKEEEKKESSVLSRLSKLGLDKRLIQKEISMYDIQLKKANQDLPSIKDNISKLKTKLDKEKQSIEKILISLYKHGKFSSLQFMLQAEDIGSLISEMKNLTLLAQYQEKIIMDYTDTMTELKAEEQKLETKKNEVSILIQNAEQKQQELEAKEKKNNALISEIKRSKKIHLQTLEELKERANQLQLLIKKLLSEETALPFHLIPLYEKKGRLPWPIDGKVITLFGLQRHPRFNTTIINNGIEISPKKDNAVVRSIHPGKVVYADYFQGYGNLIIIDHGMIYYSLYGHCSDFLVKKGDIVKAEQPIALVGDIGSLKGVSLYFEIRFKTKPLNPLKWLKRR